MSFSVFNVLSALPCMEGYLQLETPAGPSSQHIIKKPPQHTHAHTDLTDFLLQDPKFRQKLFDTHRTTHSTLSYP